MGGDYFYKNSNKKTKPRQHYTNEVVIKDKTFSLTLLGPPLLSATEELSRPLDKKLLKLLEMLVELAEDSLHRH